MLSKSCRYCKKEFTTYPSQNKNFCSIKCSKIGIKPWNTGKHRYHMMGDKNPNWTGGTTELKSKIRTSLEYKIWRNKVFERDEFICQECGDKRGGNLEADHILPLAVIMKEKNIQSFEEALSCIEIWNVDNGKTLCKDCHKKTETWGFKTLNHIIGRKYLYVN